MPLKGKIPVTRSAVHGGINEAAKLLNSGRIDEAERICRSALKTAPREPNALRLLGMIRLQQGKAAAAEKLVRKAIKVSPKSAKAYMDLGMVMTAQERLPQAIDAFRKATRLDPHFINAWFNLGQSLQKALRNNEAAKALEKAIELNPEHRKAFASLGQSLSMEGEKDSAAGAFRRGLSVQPERAVYYFNLVNLKEVSLTDEEVQGLEQRLEAGEFSGTEEIYACFALAKALEDRGDYDRGFAYLVRGNELKHRSLAFDFSQFSNMADRIIEVVDRELLERLGGGGDNWEAPIFILSLPRSGSTLVEQILASHSQITGGDEMPFSGSIMTELAGDADLFPECFENFSNKKLRQVARATYISKTQHLAKDTPYFTDKSLNNFSIAGVLHLLMPRAKFVHVLRDPMDTCLSNYRQLFSKGQTFSYDFKSLAQYYRLHERFMAHWNSIMPGLIHQVRYEELVANQEEETRRLIEFLRLPWEDSCLEFYKTKRTVRTVSTAQVRKPMSKGAVERWRKYEKHLQPLIDALATPHR